MLNEPADEGKQELQSVELNRFCAAEGPVGRAAFSFVLRYRSCVRRISIIVPSTRTMTIPPLAA